VLVSTDGALGRLPLGALPGREPGTYLLEDHRLAMIPVPRLLPGLLDGDDGRKQLDRALLAMGDVDYDADVNTPREAESVTAATGPLWKLGGDRATAVRGDRLFPPLTNTDGEIAGVRRTFSKAFFGESPTEQQTLELARITDELSGANATEARFRQLAPQFYYLHLATHGFFASPKKSSALSSDELLAAADRAGGSRAMLATRDMHVRGYNPGLLSGLAFAGANRDPAEDSDDGILTAQEIAFLPLNGVELVVLSACETGLGEVAGGEGLLGVQRAFQVAGARTTVASLWKVNDAVTRRLIERFYRNLWEKELPRLDALREAQIYILNNPEPIRGATLEDDKELDRLPPYYWAAFTLSGDWR